MAENMELVAGENIVVDKIAPDTWEIAAEFPTLKPCCPFQVKRLNHTQIQVVDGTDITSEYCGHTIELGGVPVTTLPYVNAAWVILRVLYDETLAQASVVLQTTGTLSEIDWPLAYLSGNRIEQLRLELTPIALSERVII